jgi:hypothetical protein
LLQRYGALPDVQKAAAEFDQAHKIEERFVKDFEGQDLAGRGNPWRDVSRNVRNITSAHTRGA